MSGRLLAVRIELREVGVGMGVSQPNYSKAISLYLLLLPGSTLVRPRDQARHSDLPTENSDFRRSRRFLQVDLLSRGYITTAD